MKDFIIAGLLSLVITTVGIAAGIPFGVLCIVSLVIGSLWGVVDGLRKAG